MASSAVAGFDDDRARRAATGKGCRLRKAIAARMPRTQINAQAAVMISAITIVWAVNIDQTSNMA
ncbi:MAG: hypothetical protein AAGJ87_07685, partial [Pseudomonadota bacterium]